VKLVGIGFYAGIAQAVAERLQRSDLARAMGARIEVPPKAQTLGAREASIT
jgi:hypothetical protein